MTQSTNTTSMQEQIEEAKLRFDIDLGETLEQIKQKLDEVEILALGIVKNELSKDGWFDESGYVMKIFKKSRALSKIIEEFETLSSKQHTTEEVSRE